MDVNRLDAVLPLRATDAARAQILFHSVDAFLEPLGICHVVAPDDEVAAVAASIPRHGRYVVHPEGDVIPEIGWFRTTARLRERLRIVGPPIHGWFVQQLVKLAIWERVETPFYLTLDADVLCVRPTAYDDLVPGGRALVQTSPPNHPEWMDDAERVLGLPRSGRQFGVTPALLARDAVEGLARHLAERASPRARELASWLPSRGARRVAASWRSSLLRQLPWTEYAVYHTFLEATGLFDRYHVLGGDEALYARAVWMESQFDDWPVEEVFDAENPFFFTVVQSATRIPPERVLAKVAPHLSPVPALR
jgi:hypothetical protein